MYSLLLAVIYISFISLGLPDSLLGAAWPTIYPEFGVPVSFAGVIFIVICGGTVISSLLSDRLTKWVGPGRVTVISVMITAIALAGYSFSTSYWMLLVWAVPYGLGAGSVDAALNNYVALHYKSSHMSWLHCMWGVGASVGPYIMSFALSVGQHWSSGYRYIAILQIILVVIIFASLPLWKCVNERQDVKRDDERKNALTLKEIFSIPGAKQVMLMFFCYCALEQSAGLWASSYMVLKYGLSEEIAASYGSMFFIGITIGRAISGFVAMKLDDHKMIKLGCYIILIGVVFMFIPFGYQISLIGIIIVGFGCAPIYPCIIHSTPKNFGSDKSQALIGVQMASAYLGNIIMPPLFGVIANNISVNLLPMYLLLILIVMSEMHREVLKRTVNNK
ncbi:MAG: MFS transporter [Lachnospiraceae bacterium]|nr:MFS transporter [Lachnospiraceae bacterium]MBQ4068786.1 MFS transporter [Lachnospiraceae bacterium]